MPLLFGLFVPSEQLGLPFGIRVDAQSIEDVAQ